MTPEGLLAAVLWVALLGQALLWLALANNHRHTPDLESEPVPARLLGPEAPPVLVVVPARDEEENIGPCLGALLASGYGRLSVRVVDDGSTDATAQRARARGPRVEVVAAPALPAGWLGKPHALWHATRGADAAFLLFLDADVRVAPSCVARAVAAAERAGADLVTVLPRIEARGAAELAVQPLMAQLAVAWLPAKEINDPRSPRSGAIGPFMLFRRASYERLGGHAAVRGEVAEDLRLAEAAKRAGMRLVLARATGLLSIRMYDSLRALVRGWTKNFHVALGPLRWAAPLVALLLFTVFAAPFLGPFVALLPGPRGALPLALVVAATAIFARLDLQRRYGVSARHLELVPVGAALLAFIVLLSSARAILGRPTLWRGRPVG